MPVSASRALIVVPAFNEGRGVHDVVLEIRDAMGDAADCLVIDDGSSDDTAAEARRAGALVARLPVNLGVGGALRTGFVYARDEGYTALVQVDADGQHDPRYVPDMLRRLEHADIVVGARFAGEGDYAVRGPRQWAMRVLSHLIRAVTGYRLTDTTSGFKACGPRAIALFAEHMPAEYLGDTVEALVIASRAGCRVEQLPVAMRDRTHGTPSQSPAKAAKYLMRAVMAVTVATMRPAPRVGVAR
ncbi:glycosyltransferase family 2 protein [Microbacterium sp. NPDC058021]|uniref:glycosyltransferase family 2 protein n=1 Tax=Microbacterium sp. NPDC058021 TaxID=3346306 RepID=UPI0036D7A6BC